LDDDDDDDDGGVIDGLTVWSWGQNHTTMDEAGLELRSAIRSKNSFVVRHTQTRHTSAINS
jgi:hypothetical protein